MTARIGLAVAGAGMIAREFWSISADLPGIEVAAILARESHRAELESIAPVYGDYAELLADPAVDAVYVALPNHLHHEYSRRALQAGKHVICEKPFTLTPAELAGLRAIATDRRLILVEAITNQYLANYRLIREALPRLGDLKLVHCNYSQYSSRYPAFLRGEVLPAFDPAKGGGALMDIGIYNLHFVLGLLGEPRSVRYDANIERGVDTSGVLVLDYGTCKAVCVQAKDCAAPAESYLQGNDGTIVMHGPPNSCDSFTLQLRGEEPVQIDEKIHPHRMVEEFRAFTQLVQHLDLTERDHRLDHSELVARVAAEALASAGITLG